MKNKFKNENKFSEIKFNLENQKLKTILSECISIYIWTTLSLVCMQLYEVAVAVGVGAPLLYNQFDIGLAPTAF